MNHKTAKGQRQRKTENGKNDVMSRRATATVEFCNSQQQRSACCKVQRASATPYTAYSLHQLAKWQLPCYQCVITTDL